MRQLLIVSLTLLVIGLSLMPCCAPVLTAQASVAELENAGCCSDACSDESPAKDEEKGCGTCSPFFTCGTCSGFSNAEPMVASPAPEPVSKVLSGVLTPVFYDAYYGKKWQPPKIG